MEGSGLSTKLKGSIHGIYPALHERRRLIVTHQIAACVEDALNSEISSQRAAISCLSTCVVGAVRTFHLITELRRLELWPTTSFEHKSVNSLHMALENCRIRT